MTAEKASIPRHTVFTNRDGFWVDGVRVPDDDIIALFVKGFRGETFNPDLHYRDFTRDPVEDDGWIPVGAVELLDTSAGIVMRLRFHGAFITEMCPELKVISITHHADVYVPARRDDDAGRIEAVTGCFQREIVEFDPKLFRVYQVTVGKDGKVSNRVRLEV